MYAQTLKLDSREIFSMRTCVGLSLYPPFALSEVDKERECQATSVIKVGTSTILLIPRQIEWCVKSVTTHVVMRTLQAVVGRTSVPHA